VPPPQMPGQMHGQMPGQMPGTSEFLQLALQAGKIACWIWQADTGLLSWDERAAVTLGVWHVEPTVASCTAAVHPDDRAAWVEAWRVALTTGGGGLFDCEFRLLRPSDGGLRWIAASGRTEFRDDKASRIVGVMRDVTERRQASIALEEVASRLSGIVSIAADAIISMDEHQLITMFNDGAEIIFGYKREEVIGKPLTMLMPLRFQAAHGAHVQTFATAGVQSRRMGERGEILGQRKSGKSFPAEASISRVTVDGKRFYTAVLRDITERKQSQERLEQRVADATRELRLEMGRREESQAQLLRTQRMEAFGQLTGGIAHDFNNLLTVIIGNLELLEMRLQDEKSRILLQRAQDAASMGSRLTARLLTFARRRPFEAAPLNLNEVVIGMAELLERSLGEQITLATSLEPAPWTVVADASEVENAILNLAINARDAMPSGGKLFIETANVTIDTERTDAVGKVSPGRYVRLAVSDTGCGMTEDVKRHAFEPFFTTKEPGKGTGLGLSTIYGFVQQADGALTLYSEIDQGTTINLYLPQAASEHDVTVDVCEADTGSGAAGERILLVEDNAEVRVAVSSQLESLGYAVVAVSSGPEALQELAVPDRFDLVLSDVVMAGGMTGLDVVRWVRVNAPGVRVVLASGYPDAVLRSEAPGGPQPEILRKPFGRAELARALRRAPDPA
jgi:PAS domain S-box-containing protein